MPTKVEAWQTATGQVFTDIDAALQQERDWNHWFTTTAREYYPDTSNMRAWIEDIHSPIPKDLPSKETQA